MPTSTAAGRIGRNSEIFSITGSTSWSPRLGVTEHGLAIDIALFAQFDQIVKQRPRHLGPKVAADMDKGLEPAVLGILLEPHRVAGAGSNPVVDIGAKL